MSNENVDSPIRDALVKKRENVGSLSKLEMCFSFKLNLPPTWITPKKHYLSARFGFEYLKYPPCPSPQMGIFLICASRTWTILVWKKKRKSTSREVLMHILAQLSLFRASKEWTTKIVCLSLDDFSVKNSLESCWVFLRKLIR